jgi:phosphohistidine phosphatase SixA
MTIGTPISRRALAALLGLPLVSAPLGAADLWPALRGGGHFALIRHALAPGTLDPPGFQLGDCATQRNLSAEGRAQAARMGDLFRSNAIASARLYSSQWCRCLDTATLSKLGDVTPQPLLNYFGQDRTRRAPQLEALRGWIATLDLTQPTLLVTHQVVIAALTEASADSGEIVVMQRQADGRLFVRGRQPTA